MPCVAALIVLSVLGIFSASHRKLAKDAFDCVFRRIRLKPCNTGFDIRVKSMILGPLIGRSPKIAKFINARFELLSWMFMIILVWSSIWAVHGIYNYWVWGSCQGLNSGGFCAFDPTGSHNQISSAEEDCVDLELAQQGLSMTNIDLEQLPVRSGKDDVEVVLLGCYSCEYTRKVYPIIQSLREKYWFNYYFIHFPTKDETRYLTYYDHCVETLYPEKYFEYVDGLFAGDRKQISEEGHVQEMLAGMGMDTGAMLECVESEETQQAVAIWMRELENAGIYGTPTVFIDDMGLVGPKPYRVYRRLITGWAL